MHTITNCTNYCVKTSGHISNSRRATVALYFGGREEENDFGGLTKTLVSQLRELEVDPVRL